MRTRIKKTKLSTPKTTTETTTQPTTTGFTLNDAFFYGAMTALGVSLTSLCVYGYRRWMKPTKQTTPHMADHMTDLTLDLDPLGEMEELELDADAPSEEKSLVMTPIYTPKQELN